MPMHHYNNFEELVPMINSLSIGTNHLLSNNCPPGDSFSFFDYNGRHSNDELIVTVNKSTLNYGTRQKSRLRPNSSTSRIETIEFPALSATYHSPL